MPSSCKELYNAVVECLRESDCIKNGYSPAECIRMPLKEKLPAQCQNLLHAYGECKRRNIDMRYRFRGNNPLGTAQELHQNQESVPQLYGGRPALPPMPGTDGNDGQKKE
ncbi:hypothetical protein EYR41_008618 [Orbilia oligospora]|uniref:Uncharacterized protein n=1 Tax=Orbilia oligospora TaxID=2813651 RepID=A0A7C8K6H3_ORBOL|nr:hypothetical protein TWF751_010575 [Orbilia oligospora]TGJ67033.1 hypothetical protein EYR41_008618 [Orbilia oligospora]